MSTLLIILGIITLGAIIIIISDGKTMEWIDYFQEKTKVSDAVAGELYQGVATSFPEMSIMIVSVVFLGLNPVIGLSSSIGSGVFQFLPVIGIPALFARKPLGVDKYEVMRSVGFYILLLGVLYMTVMDGIVSIYDLLLLVAMRVLYIIRTIKIRPKQKKHRGLSAPLPQGGQEEEKKEEQKQHSTRRKVYSLFTKFEHIVPGPDSSRGMIGGYIPLGFIMCLAIIGISVYYLIGLTESLGVMRNIPLAFLSLTVLAGISSLPELATNIPLAKRGSGDQIIGNAVGSNSIDIAISFALMTIIAAAIQSTGNFTLDDIGAIQIAIGGLIAVALLFLGVLRSNNRHIGRRQGRGLTLAYVVYVIVSYFQY